jgi:predicted ArsR family transcriptional regulator
MKNKGLKSEDLTILNALLRKPRLTFQEIIDLKEFNRNQTRKRLTTLIKKRLIKEENKKSWRQGQKLYFALTQKGRELLWTHTLDSVKVSLEMIDILASEALSRPKELAALREEARHAIHTIATDESLSFEESAQQTAKTREAYFGPFRKALETMHQITLKLFTPRAAARTLLADAYISINEEGVIDAISAEDITKHPDITVTSI